MAWFRQLAMIAVSATMGCNALFGVGELSFDGGTSTASTGGAGGTGGTATGTSDGGSGGTGGSGGMPTGGGGGMMPDLCGDGVLDDGEQCDDGNDLIDDGCEDCTVICLGELEPTTLHCYRWTDADLSYVQALAACEAWGGHLATLTSQAENDFVTPIAQSDTWIGADDLQDEGIFQWITGEPWAFDAWNTGEPNNMNNEDCTELRNGVWNDQSCVSANAHLCEREPPVASP